MSNLRIKNYTRVRIIKKVYAYNTKEKSISGLEYNGNKQRDSVLNWKKRSEVYIVKEPNIRRMIIKRTAEAKVRSGQNTERVTTQEK